MSARRRFNEVSPWNLVAVGACSGILELLLFLSFLQLENNIG